VDPEEARLAELARAAGKGSANEAEREELALYVDDDAAARERALRIADEAALGGEWLERVHADDKLHAIERSGLTRLERIAGFSLVSVGGVLTVLFPVVGVPLLLLGTAILGFSVARVRLATFRADPYNDIER
jgi:hypothetical protein